MQKIHFTHNDHGYFSLKFGVKDFGPKGLDSRRFTLESKEHSLQMEFHGNLFDLFTRFELNADYFNNSCIERKVLKVYEENGSCVVEAGSGSLYDLLKESAAEETGTFRCKKPITFYWKGVSEAA